MNIFRRSKIATAAYIVAILILVGGISGPEELPYKQPSISSSTLFQKWGNW